MKRKNVLHLVEYLYLGGIERLLEQMAIKIDGKVKLHFFTYETQQLAGIGKNIQDMGFPVFTYKKSRGRDWSLVRELIRVIQEKKIDVIHTHDFGPVEYAVILKMRFPHLKLIHTQHTMHHFIAKAHYRYFFQFASYFYNTVICVSEFVRESYIENCPLMKRSALKVIPNGVDIVKFHPENQIELKKDKLNLVTVARISREKNLQYLFNTFRLLKQAGIPFEFNHAGTSMYQEQVDKLENYVHEHGLEKEVKMHGYQENASQILALGDYFLSSSVREGHPVSLLEAMASEKVCICSDIAPHREISHGAVALYDTNDETALFNKLKEIYNNRPDFAEQKQSARAIVVNNYSIEKMVDSYVELYS